MSFSARADWWREAATNIKLLKDERKRIMPPRKTGGSKRSGGAKKETSDRISKLASKALRGENLTKTEIKSLGASLLSQDETKGPRKSKKP